MAKTVVPQDARQRRRRTKQGQVLSHELIVETALRMLSEHGAEGLTARRLGLGLGADASAVYRYFNGMDDLVLAIADELMSRAVQHWQPVGDWRSDLRDLGLRIHSAYLAHPQAAVLTANRVSGRPHEIAADEAILGLLRGAGFPDRTAVRIYHVFIDQSLAFAALDAASIAMPAAARQLDEEVWKATYARLPELTHPHIASTAALLVERMNLSAYPAALDMVLAAAAAELAAVTG
ncbi:TetR/AcrR family transcriptional regulator [Streptacidiphilus sp. PB12-B1b]|uniref:TetR/AcrR family transcriptional regulator n=1 Tax=Streptacidiphilus sp. PB12-B1b TaxID=2705012 RepID=UPI0015FDB52B|nr:TetR family transcriptional regulator [Streptacidiphilus sp. PB12-B1b]QMU77485.1 TetR/AcrR family transcriptional regulator [Streptacidiphilus sp. PB12-B1b]